MQFFIIWWPALLSLTYFAVGFWPITLFGGRTDSYYAYSAVVVGVLGILSTLFWGKPIFRNVLVSFLLARSFASLMLAIYAEPQSGMSAVARLSAAGALSLVWFFLASAELPLVKEMSEARKNGIK